MPDCGTPTAVLVLAAVPPTLGAVAAFIASVRGNRKVDDVGLAVNGRLEQLVAAREDAAYHRGYIRSAPPDPPPEPMEV